LRFHWGICFLGFGPICEEPPQPFAEGATSLKAGQGQATFQITQVPKYYTPERDTIFLAGDFNNWQPDDPNYAFVKSNGAYSLTLQGAPGATIQFKCTRGDWNVVETQLNGSFLPNRAFTFGSAPQIEPLTIANWNDLLGWHTATGDVRLLDLDFPIPQLNRQRRIWLYLPPGYDTSTARYPVLYMLDGQNLFDAVYAPFGEWQVDEALEQLRQMGYTSGAIIVGIDHGDAHRIDEYAPWVNPSYGGGEALEFSKFIVNTLKPYVDQHYRTLPGREHTGIMGSSMGGLLAYCMALGYQQVFSKAGIFSPSFWFTPTELRNFILSRPRQQRVRFYFLAGGQEPPSMVTNIQHARHLMMQKGFPNKDLKLVVKNDGAHSEWFWVREFPYAFWWLFEK